MGRVGKMGKAGVVDMVDGWCLGKLGNGSEVF